MDDRGLAACRLGTAGAVAALVGVVLSGPLALLVVNATHPQPPWLDAATFARSYHPVQALPFVAGFLLVGGLVLLVASLHALAPAARRPITSVAMLLAGVFASLVFLNYVVQSTFLPHLARHRSPADDPLIGALAMANPTSLAWALEMWGYGLLGVATWLVAPVLREGRLEQAASAALVVNGPASVLPAVLTAIAPGWELTTPGIASLARRRGPGPP
jgi:hypothetical protein